MIVLLVAQPSISTARQDNQKYPGRLPSPAAATRLKMGDHGLPADMLALEQLKKISGDCYAVAAFAIDSLGVRRDAGGR
jgi:hypothetical protein